MGTDRPNVPVKSVERMLELVERLQERDGATVSELADDLDVAKSTVHNHLLTLERQGYVSKNDGKYVVGLRFLDHGGHARARNPGYERVRPRVYEVATETGELCSFVAEEAGKGIVVFEERGDRAVETQSRVGRFDHLHALPGGKAILASLDRDRVESIVDRHGLPPVTDRTVTDREELFSELNDVADRGYAVNAEEYLRSLNAISVPILTADGETVGALTVVGPSHRLSDDAVEEAVTDQLLGVSNELELNLTYSRR